MEYKVNRGTRKSSFDILSMHIFEGESKLFE